MKFTIALTSILGALAIIAQAASACTVNRIYRGMIDRVGHDTYPIGSVHTLTTTRGSVTLQVGYRSAPGLGWQLPNGAMNRLGYVQEVNQGTACVTRVR